MFFYLFENMCNLLKNILPLILVLLKLFASISGQNFSLQSLGVICSIYNYSKVSTLPEQCTAMAAFTSLEGQVDGANKIRGNLPLLIIVDTLLYFEDLELLKKDPAEVLKDYKNVSFDCMAIAYMYKYASYSETTSQDIGNFLDKAKQEFPGKGFGLVLNRFLRITEFSENLKVLIDHSDFVLLDTKDYRFCVHQNHQADMAVLATKDDVLGSLNQIKDKHQPLDKVIFYIGLKIVSQTPLSGEDMDYSYARLRITEGMAGILILGIDYDDYSGTCGCITSTDSNSTFRGLKTIAGASTEDKNEVNFYKCSKGEYPVIKK